SSQVPPPPPPPPSSTSQDSPSKGFAAPSPSKTAALAEYQAWTTTDIRLMPSISLTPTDLEMDEDMAPDEQAQLSDDEDIGSAHIPMASTLASNYSPLPEDSLLAQTGDIATFMDWFCKSRGITELKPQDLEGPAYEIVKVFHPDVIHLQYQMEECHKLLTDSVDDPLLKHNVSKSLPLGGPPGQADMKEILHQHMWETKSYKSHKDHMQLFEAIEKSMNHDHSDELAQDLAEARKKKKKSHELPKTPPGSPSHQPPPPPLPAGPSGPSRAPGASGSSQVPPPPPPPPSSTSQDSPSKGFAAPSPSKTAALAEYQAWTTTDIRLMPSISLTPTDLEMDEDMAPDEQAQLSDDEDIGSAHIPMASTLASNYSPLPEDSLLAQTGDIATFMDWFCKRRGITELKPQDLEGPAYEIVKVFHPRLR
nr:hypothetical protein [Tanacetum cinerariifolium]